MAEQTIDYKLLAKELAPHLNPPKVEKPDPVVTDQEEGAYFDEETQQVIYTDPAVKAADKATERALETMPMGTAVYKGRGRTQIINHSQETLEAIDNWKKSRRQYRTRTNV